jgi:hypothetical protein
MIPVRFFEVPTQMRGYNDRNFKSTALVAVQSDPKRLFAVGAPH